MEDNETIMDIDVNNLKEKQYNFLRNRVKTILNEIIKDLDNNNLQRIASRLSYSPSGDGWGCDNYFINFSYKDKEDMDLHYIIEKMAELKNIEIEEDC